MRVQHLFEPYVAVVNLAPLSRCGSAPGVTPARCSPSAVALPACLPAVQGGVACCVHIAHARSKMHAHTRRGSLLMAVRRRCLVDDNFKRVFVPVMSSTFSSCCKENTILYNTVSLLYSLIMHLFFLMLGVAT